MFIAIFSKLDYIWQNFCLNEEVFTVLFRYAPKGEKITFFIRRGVFLWQDRKLLAIAGGAGSTGKDSVQLFLYIVVHGHNAMKIYARLHATADLSHRAASSSYNPVL